VTFDLAARTYQRVTVDVSTYIVTAIQLDPRGHLLAVSPGLVYGNNTWSLVQVDPTTGMRFLCSLFVVLFLSLSLCRSAKHAVQAASRTSPRLFRLTCLLRTMVVRSTRWTIRRSECIIGSAHGLARSLAKWCVFGWSPQRKQQQQLHKTQQKTSRKIEGWC
jgi:hypothetical protein